jgi:hypothetical protein
MPGATCHDSGRSGRERRHQRYHCTVRVPFEAWRAEYFEVVSCPALLAEIAEKLHLPRIRKKYSIRD